MGFIIEIYDHQLSLRVPAVTDFSCWRAARCRMFYKRYCLERNLVGSDSVSVVNEFFFYRLSTT